MIVHVDLDDLNFLLDQLTANLEATEDTNDPFFKEGERLIERVCRKIDQAKAREERKICRELINANRKSIRRFRPSL